MNGRNYKIDRIELHEVTMAEKDEIYDELIDLICDSCVDFDIIPGMFNDTFVLRIVMKDIEKFSISIDHESITTLEIVTRDYIFMHDVTTATGVILS